MIEIDLPDESFNLARCGKKRAFLAAVEGHVLGGLNTALKDVVLVHAGHPNLRIAAEVTRITITRFGELTTADAQALGYLNLNQFQASIRFDQYPDLVDDRARVSINHFRRTDRAGG